MSDDERGTREEGKQNPVIHEGADPDPQYDGNERADERVEVVNPEGDPAPRVEGGSSDG